MRKVMGLLLVALIGVLGLGIDTASASSAGQFCKKADLGKIVTADNGKTIICKLDSGGRARWTNYAAPTPPTARTYTARYTAAENAFIVRAANFYHLRAQDVPKTGVQVLAFFLKLAPHADQKPQAKPTNNGPITISTTYSTASMKADMGSVSHYIALNGHDTMYVGGLVMGYLAALGGG